MKQIQLLSFLVCFTFCFVACKQDVKSEPLDSEGVIQSDASTEEQAEAILENIEEQNAALEDIDQVENTVEVELEEVFVDEEKKAQEKKEILEAQLDKSPNKGKTCDDMLKEYEDLVNKYLNGGGVAALKELSSWSNDPLFNTCKKNPAYKDKFAAIEEKMEED